MQDYYPPDILISSEEDMFDAMKQFSGIASGPRYYDVVAALAKAMRGEIKRTLYDGYMPVFYSKGSFYTTKKTLLSIREDARHAIYERKADLFWKSVDKFADGKKIAIKDGSRARKSFDSLEDFLDSMDISDNKSIQSTPREYEYLMWSFLDLKKFNKYFTKGTVNYFKIKLIESEKSILYSAGLKEDLDEKLENVLDLPDGYFQYINRPRRKSLKLPKSLDNRIQFKVWCGVVDSVAITHKSLKELIGYKGDFHPTSRLGNYQQECLEYIIKKSPKVVDMLYYKNLSRYISYYNRNNDDWNLD